jgi:carbon-monoxide dehydrogenase large subunit
VEDPRLLAGQGAYLDDLRLPGLLHAAFVRSPYAHARVRSVDVERARKTPGVAAALSGLDIASWIAPFAPRLESEFPG